jgi:hypothetical protein
VLPEPLYSRPLQKIDILAHWIIFGVLFCVWFFLYTTLLLVPGMFLGMTGFSDVLKHLISFPGIFHWVPIVGPFILYAMKLRRYIAKGIFNVYSDGDGGGSA